MFSCIVCWILSFFSHICQEKLWKWWKRHFGKLMEVWWLKNTTIYFDRMFISWQTRFLNCNLHRTQLNGLKINIKEFFLKIFLKKNFLKAVLQVKNKKRTEELYLVKIKIGSFLKLWTVLLCPNYLKKNWIIFFF